MPFDYSGVIDFYHQLHRIPEIALHEFQTSAAIREFIAPLPLKVLPPAAETDTVALLYGKKDTGKTILLRADIDALPLEEKSGVPFASLNKGMMHACGHDAHSAILAGTAIKLSQMQDKLNGNICFVWQPAEEKVGGAKHLVESGIFDKMHLSFAFALHCMPGIPVGAAACRTGAVMAGVWRYSLSFTGIGAHGSMPEKANSPIPPMAEAIFAIEALRNKHQDLVLSTGVVNAGALDNIIPESSLIAGTARSESMQSLKMLMDEIESSAKRIAKKYNVKYSLEATPGYNPTINSQAAVKIVRAGVSAVGCRYMDMEKCKMTAEDFSNYLDKCCPGAMFHLGVGTDAPGLHTAEFSVPDEVIRYGVDIMTETALAALA